jgi:c-di-GMP-binding flagellar brake protein YcgR
MPSQSLALSPPVQRAVDRRRHHRVRVALLGRYMLASRQEFPCQTVDMSPGGLNLVAPVRGLIGERIVVYLEHLGRIEGQIVRHTDLGVALAIGATIRKRDKLAAQLTWLVNRQSLGLPEDRRHERIVPRHSAVRVKIADRAEVTGRLIDVSLSGAAVSLEERPALGAVVTLGKTTGRVVRHFEGGIAVEFLLPMSPDRFDEGVIL